VYVILVHHALKFTSFLIPDNSPSKEELLSSMRRSVAGNQRQARRQHHFLVSIKTQAKIGDAKKGRKVSAETKSNLSDVFLEQSFSRVRREEFAKS
jgi:hypothetical protein